MDHNESRLQKDFKQRDIQRMRNLITKKYGDKTATQAGYIKKQEDHVEGDVWEENGKKWTIKKGIKQTITRFDEIKKSLTLPIVCPNCDKHMANHPINKKMWPIHGMCFDCVIKMETELKRDGKWEEYQSNITKSSIRTLIREMEAILLDVMLDDNKESFITEVGDIEEWRGGVIDKTKIAENIQEYIKKLKDILES